MSPFQIAIAFNNMNIAPLLIPDNLNMEDYIHEDEEEKKENSIVTK